jgi:hypothetical protein
MAISSEDLKAITEAVEIALENKQHEYWIEAEMHYLDHQQLKRCQANQAEWQLNHQFISELRQASSSVKKIALRTSVALIVTAAASWVVYMFSLGVHK